MRKRWGEKFKIPSYLVEEYGEEFLDNNPLFLEILTINYKINGRESTHSDDYIDRSDTKNVIDKQLRKKHTKMSLDWRKENRERHNQIQREYRKKLKEEFKIPGHIVLRHGVKYLRENKTKLKELQLKYN